MSLIGGFTTTFNELKQYYSPHYMYFIICAVQNDIEVLERTIQEKNGEIRRLQKQTADLERAKHTEVVKLRLEVSIVPFISKLKIDYVCIEELSQANIYYVNSQ